MTLQDKIYSYFERNPQLRVLFIFSNAMQPIELREMEWREGVVYAEARNNWFTIKYRLDHEWADKHIVLYVDRFSPLDQVPPRDDFPLMDVLAANMAFCPENYLAFMQEHHITNAKLATFVQDNLQLLQTDKMVRMLQPYYDEGTFTKDVGTRAVVTNFLRQTTLLGWDEIIIRMLSLRQEGGQKRVDDFYYKLRKARQVKEGVDQKLMEVFGTTYDDNTVDKVMKLVQMMKYNAITQNLVPVGADHYHSSLRINDAAQLQQLNRIFEVALNSPKLSTAFKQTIDTLGSDVHDDDLIKWYGTEANYNYLPQALCVPILHKLIVDDLPYDPERVMERTEMLMLRQSDSEELRDAEHFCITASRYYQVAAEIGSVTLDSPDDYVAQYRKQYFSLDQLYRLTLAAYYHISPTSVLYDTAQEAKLLIDQHYAKLCHLINLEWTHCLMETNGWKSITLPRQHDFYNDCVRPVQKKVCVIVSDALRYEVAEELVRELAKTRHKARLDAMLAMLPTETKYDKPSLLPHASLSLYGTEGEQRMCVDHKVLDATQKRSAQLQSYRAESVCVTYEEVAQYVATENRETFKNSLVYIFHNTIDDLGHDASGKQVVEGCQRAVEELSTLVKKVLGSYNVTEVYVTADHGFLFNDMPFAEKDKVKVDEECLEKKSRYYLTTSGEKVSQVAKFALSDVSGMDNVGHLYVAVPEGTNRLAAPSGGYAFAHGGAALQEVIVPLVVCSQERQDTKQAVGVVLLSRRLSVVSSRLRFQLLQTQRVNMEQKARTVTVALYVGDQPVTAVQQIVLDKTAPLLEDRKIVVDLTLTKHVDQKVLQLKVFDANDPINPLVKENVTNNTLIDNDFDF